MEVVLVGIQKVVNKSVKPIHVILADDHTLVRAGIRIMGLLLAAVAIQFMLDATKAFRLDLLGLAAT
jgi:hypothetical protein